MTDFDPDQMNTNEEGGKSKNFNNFYILIAIPY